MAQVFIVVFIIFYNCAPNCFQYWLRDIAKQTGEGLHSKNCNLINTRFRFRFKKMYRKWVKDFTHLRYITFHYLVGLNQQILNIKVPCCEDFSLVLSQLRFLRFTNVLVNCMLLYFHLSEVADKCGKPERIPLGVCYTTGLFIALWF